MASDRYLAVQLGIEDPSVVKRYTERRRTLYDHAWEIRDAYGYRPYEDVEWGRRFRTFLHGRAWTHAEGPKALFDHAVGWLRRHRVLLPGVSVLARQVSEVRKVADKRLPALPGDLVATLKTPEGSRFSELERLRRPPTRTTGTAFARALEWVDEIGAYRLGRLRLSQIPPNRMAALARYALGSKAPLLERAVEPKRTAMLTAVMRHLEAKAIDEALDLFQVLMATRLLNTAKRKTEKERLSMLPQLEKASRVLARAAKVLFEELELVEEQETDLDVAALWAAVEEVAPRAAVMTAAATVVTLVPKNKNSAEVAMRAALASRYATVRPFLALLGESKALDAASAGKRVLAGVRGLPALARRKVGVKPLLPREVDDKLVPPAWRKAVYANPDLRRARWTGTRTWCACWSSCTGP
ncbi:hypothetical protein GCM10010392_04210 [Streptomyces clavifer]|uniref:DUF4158 domain-containing protein n=1 Tax=Streptomyces clavifer TaxID=68188 RepID=A0ABS4V614_9ACTN|nr:hypothetical protein [Streptomyces clavifer]GHA81271.1 hypothetical protein GCM10010392_04210 [Streptomyces clavifer]